MVIIYNIKFNPAALGFADSASAYLFLSTSLKNAVSSGNFTAHLKEQSAAAGGSGDLSSCTSSTVTASDPVVVNEDGNSSSKKKTNNTALIIGLVVGIGGGLILIGALVYFFTRQSGPKANAVYAAPHDIGIDLVPSAAMVHQNHAAGYGV